MGPRTCASSNSAGAAVLWWSGRSCCQLLLRQHLSPKLCAILTILIHNLTSLLHTLVRNICIFSWLRGTSPLIMMSLTASCHVRMTSAVAHGVVKWGSRISRFCSSCLCRAVALGSPPLPMQEHVHQATFTESPQSEDSFFPNLQWHTVHCTACADGSTKRWSFTTSNSESSSLQDGHITCSICDSI